jgi:hypothetical protein
MRRRISYLILSVGCAAALGAEPLKVEIGIIRFRPRTSLDLLRPPDEVIRNHSGKAQPQLNSVKAVVSALEKAGVAEALISTNLTLMEDSANLELNERYRLTTLNGGQSLPDVTKIALRLELRAIAVQMQRELRWKGDLQWSPELIDYVNGRTLRFKDAFMAEEESKSKKPPPNASTTEQPPPSLESLSTNVIRSVFPREEKGIFELPVVKSSSLSGSKMLQPRQPIFQSTVAEGGGTSSQAIVLVLLPQWPEAPPGGGKKK